MRVLRDINGKRFIIHPTFIFIRRPLNDVYLLNGGHIAQLLNIVLDFFRKNSFHNTQYHYQSAASNRVGKTRALCPMIHLEHAVIVCDTVAEKRFEIGDVSHTRTYIYNYYNCYYAGGGDIIQLVRSSSRRSLPGEILRNRICKKNCSPRI